MFAIPSALERRGSRDGVDGMPDGVKVGVTGEGRDGSKGW